MRIKNKDTTLSANDSTTGYQLKWTFPLLYKVTYKRAYGHISIRNFPSSYAEVF